MSDDPDLPSAEDIAATRGEGERFRRPIPFDDSEHNTSFETGVGFPPPPREDEMVAGLIHEPGTGGEDYVEIKWRDGFEQPPMFDEVDQAEPMGDNPHYMGPAAAAQLTISQQQRDFLMGQCSSLINRLAGAHVAAGFIDLAGAQGFALKETLPINQVLQQIAAANEPQP